MKVSVVTYNPPEESSLSPLGVISGASLEKARKYALNELNDDDELKVRLVKKGNRLIVEESYLDEGDWTPWAESGATVTIDTFNLDC